jgi:N6-adenosine-specific RNA methylase IME4
MQRAEKAQARRKKRTELLVETSNANAPLPKDRRYPVIYADPPWQYDHMISVSREIENQYQTMTIEAICALDVAALTTPDAMLFLWVPPSFLHKGIRVIEAWGFSYLTSMVWDKMKMGMGYYACQRHEHLLLACRGKAIVPSPSALSPSVIAVKRGKHSEKPAEFYALIERMYPTLPKIELFARSRRNGWGRWGNQLEAA